MASRPLIIASLLGASIGVPYFTTRMSHSTPQQNAGLPGSLHAAGPTDSASPATTLNSPPVRMPIEGPGSLVYSSPAPLEGTRFHSAEHVLRFDVTKDWVYRNWARKTTWPTDVGLFAVRVPLVSGTQVGSLAGSLTYYFNSQGQVEHIGFRGRTGDTTPLINFLQRTYAFERRESPVGEQLYQVRRGRNVQSELRTRAEGVLWSTSPHGSFAVELELARPGSKRVLPPRGSGLAIPQVASPAPPATSAAQQSAEDKGSGSSFLDKVRYATPKEEEQVLWKRWPG